MDSSSKKTWDFAKKHEGKKSAKARKKIASKSQPLHDKKTQSLLNKISAPHNASHPDYMK